MRRYATKNDFKVGTILIYGNYTYTLIRKIKDGVWESENDIHRESYAPLYIIEYELTDFEKLIEETSDENKKALLFLFKKMEYSASKKFNADKFISILNEEGHKNERGYNPTILK